MRKEIIITTEKVVVSEMNEREKTIYDAGYQDGLKQGEYAKWNTYNSGIVSVLFLTFLAAIYFFL